MAFLRLRFCTTFSRPPVAFRCLYLATNSCLLASLRFRKNGFLPCFTASRSSACKPIHILFFILHSLFLSKAGVMRDERLRYTSEWGSVIGQLPQPDRQGGQTTQGASCSSTAKDALACFQQHLRILPASQSMQNHAQCMQHVCYNCRVAVSESIKGADQSCNLISSV